MTPKFGRTDVFVLNQSAIAADLDILSANYG
jgi:hypothetical protein